MAFLVFAVASLGLGELLHHLGGGQPYSDVIVGFLLALGAGLYVRT